MQQDTVVQAPADAGVPVTVVVAIPAHDEEDLLPGCLGGVLEAIGHARAAGAVDRGLVAVGAHRCHDRTAPAARDVLASGLPAPDWAVVEDRHSDTVADVRRGAIEAGTRLMNQSRARLIDRGSGAWVFNTDADSLVPAEWITAALQAARPEQAVAVAGLVRLRDWDPAPRVRQAYQALVSRGVHGTGHDHAHGANLAVRLDAYRAVGGFTPRRHGEDHDLLRRLRAAGLTVATPLTPAVETSGREDPRSPAGLGALLQRLRADSTPVT